VDRAERIINKIKKSYPAVVIIATLFLLSSIITISQGVNVAKNYYEKTLGKKQGYLDDVKKLSAGTNIDYIKRIVGNPVFVHKIGNKKNDEKLKEYIFVNDMFYTQVITDDTDTVLMYSVTTRNIGFNPTFEEWDGEKYVSITLGKSHFVDFQNIPDKVNVYCGARRVNYSEEHYFGNPGKYQTYILSENDAGVFSEESANPCDIQDPASDNIDPNNEKVTKFRREGLVNTFSVTSPLYVNEDEFVFNYGPNLDEVRVLPENK